MKKFEIMTDNFEFSFFGKQSVPACTPEDILEWYWQGTSNEPQLKASFESLEEARAEFEKYYATYGKTRLVPWTGKQYLLTGELAWIEENEYDDDGEFVYGLDIDDYSAEGYAPENSD